MCGKCGWRGIRRGGGNVSNKCSSTKYQLSLFRPFNVCFIIIIPSANRCHGVRLSIFYHTMTFLRLEKKLFLTYKVPVKSSNSNHSRNTRDLPLMMSKNKKNSNGNAKTYNAIIHDFSLENAHSNYKFREFFLPIPSS